MRQIVEQEGFEVVAAVQDGGSLVDSAIKLVPDLIVLEFALPVMNGIEAARRIHRHNSAIKMLFLSTNIHGDHIADARRAGATGYVSKTATLAQLGTAMREMLQSNSRRFNPWDQQTRSSVPLGPECVNCAANLTVRQRKVVELVSQGLTAKQVGGRLNISTRTAEYHRTRVMEVLHLRTTAELTRYAVRHRISAT